MRECLWTLRRGAARADAFLTDFRVNGVELQIVITDERARVDRFKTRELAVAQSEQERAQLRGQGWQ